MPGADNEGGRQQNDERRPVGAPGALLSRIPLRSRLAATIGGGVGLFASIVLSGVSDRLSMGALWVGVGSGIVAAVICSLREGRR